MNKEVAGGTYVEISREDFEDWLSTTGYRWERDKTRAGIYYVKLSDKVGVKISSSIGSRDVGLARGHASVQISLVSLATGQVLNKKALGRSHLKRTKGWRTTWKKALDEFNGVYRKSKDWYDKIAVLENREAYATKWKEEIESVSEWEKDRLLKDFHDKLSRNGVLSDKQEALIERAKARSGGGGAPAAPSRGKVDEDLLGKLRELWKRARDAKARGDRDGDWTMGFAQKMGEKVKGGRPLSSRETSKIEEKLRRYRIASIVEGGAIQRVASQFLRRSLA